MNLSEQKAIRLHFQSQKFFEIRFEGMIFFSFQLLIFHKEKTLQIFSYQGNLEFGKAVPHSIEKTNDVLESSGIVF